MLASLGFLHKMLALCSVFFFDFDALNIVKLVFLFIILLSVFLGVGSVIFKISV